MPCGQARRDLGRLGVRDLSRISDRFSNKAHSLRAHGTDHNRLLISSFRAEFSNAINRKDKLVLSGFKTVAVSRYQVNQRLSPIF